VRVVGRGGVVVGGFGDRGVVRRLRVAARPLHAGEQAAVARAAVGARQAARVRVVGRGGVVVGGFGDRLSGRLARRRRVVVHDHVARVVLVPPNVFPRAHGAGDADPARAGEFAAEGESGGEVRNVCARPA
jgi:hypothetical protein